MNGPPTRLRHRTLGMRARRFLSARGGRAVGCTRGAAAPGAAGAARQE